MDLFKGVLDGLHDPPGVDDICSFGFGFCVDRLVRIGLISLGEMVALVFVFLV